MSKKFKGGEKKNVPPRLFEAADAMQERFVQIAGLQGTEQLLETSKTVRQTKSYAYLRSTSALNFRTKLKDLRSNRNLYRRVIFGEGLYAHLGLDANPVLSRQLGMEGDPGPFNRLSQLQQLTIGDDPPIEPEEWKFYMQCPRLAVLDVSLNLDAAKTWFGDGLATANRLRELILSVTVLVDEEKRRLWADHVLRNISGSDLQVLEVQLTTEARGGVVRLLSKEIVQSLLDRLPNLRHLSLSVDWDDKFIHDLIQQFGGQLEYLKLSTTERTILVEEDVTLYRLFHDCKRLRSLVLEVHGDDLLPQLFAAHETKGGEWNLTMRHETRAESMDDDWKQVETMLGWLFATGIRNWNRVTLLHPYTYAPFLEPTTLSERLHALILLEFVVQEVDQDAAELPDLPSQNQLEWMFRECFPHVIVFNVEGFGRNHRFHFEEFWRNHWRITSLDNGQTLAIDVANAEDRNWETIFSRTADAKSSRFKSIQLTLDGSAMDDVNVGLDRAGARVVSLSWTGYPRDSPSAVGLSKFAARLGTEDHPRLQRLILCRVSNTMQKQVLDYGNNSGELSALRHLEMEFDSYVLRREYHVGLTRWKNLNTFLVRQDLLDALPTMDYEDESAETKQEQRQATEETVTQILHNNPELQSLTLNLQHSQIDSIGTEWKSATLTSLEFAQSSLSITNVQLELINQMPRLQLFTCRRSPQACIVAVPEYGPCPWNDEQAILDQYQTKRSPRCTIDLCQAALLCPAVYDAEPFADLPWMAADVMKRTAVEGLLQEDQVWIHAIRFLGGEEINLMSLTQDENTFHDWLTTIKHTGSASIRKIWVAREWVIVRILVYKVYFIVIANKDAKTIELAPSSFFSSDMNMKQASLFVHRQRNDPIYILQHHPDMQSLVPGYQQFQPIDAWSYMHPNMFAGYGKSLISSNGPELMYFLCRALLPDMERDGITHWMLQGGRVRDKLLRLFGFLDTRPRHTISIDTKDKTSSSMRLRSTTGAPSSLQLPSLEVQRQRTDDPEVFEFAKAVRGDRSFATRDGRIVYDGHGRFRVRKWQPNEVADIRQQLGDLHPLAPLVVVFESSSA
jgi:hypothetical protein